MIDTSEKEKYYLCNQIDNKLFYDNHQILKSI
jgi:hypothetical protein